MTERLQENSETEMEKAIATDERETQNSIEATRQYWRIGPVFYV